METLAHFAVIATLMSHAVLAYPHAFPDKEEIRPGVLQYVLRLLERSPASGSAFQDFNNHKEKLEEPGKDLPETGELLEQKTKKSPLYRLTGPINRQTRLASFGSLILPKFSDASSRNVLRYGK